MRLRIVTLALLVTLVSATSVFAQDSQNAQDTTDSPAAPAPADPATPAASVTPAASAPAQPTQAQSEGSRKITNKIVPSYPPLARGMKLRGTVKLQALVLANGKVKSIQVKGGNALLVQTAETAAREWRWEKADHDTTELLQFKFSPD